MMAFVFGVIAASIFAGSMHLVFGSQSTNTAVAPGNPDRLGRREERVRMRDDLVARADAHRHQRQPDRVGPVAGPDGVRHAVKRRQLLLELLEHRPLDVLAAFDHPLDVRVDLRLDVPVLPDVPVKTHLHHHLHLDSPTLWLPRGAGIRSVYIERGGSWGGEHEGRRGFPTADFASSGAEGTRSTQSSQIPSCRRAFPRVRAAREAQFPARRVDDYPLLSFSLSAAW